MYLPYISCICPTYKRPKLLYNAIACFEAQDYPKDRCELIVLDDAGQYSSSTNGNVRVVSIANRYSNLPKKFNHLVSLTKGDVIAPWEDDDIFLPWHLNNVAQAFGQGKSQFFTSNKVWCTHDHDRGQAGIVEATGGFHSSWRFTRELIDQVGGYPDTDELAFDFLLGKRLEQASGGQAQYGEPSRPSYIYRWGNGYWHGSQQGGSGFSSMWDYVGSLPFEYEGVATAKYDQETRMLLDWLREHTD